MNAWCRQSGHSRAWAGSVSRVRRTTRRDLASAIARCPGDVGGLGDLGFAAVGVGDVGPGVLVDGGDAPCDVLVLMRAR